MNFFSSKNTYSRRILSLFFGFLLLLLSLYGCQKKLDYSDYVSELRSNIFLCKTEKFSLRIYAVEKESPYAMDGIAQQTSPRFEAYLIAPSGDKTVHLRFTLGKESYGGEMSYDNVKRQYYYFCSMDVSKESQITCEIDYGEENINLTASSVLQSDTLSPKQALTKLMQTKSELFANMTDKYGFAGEIYLRLIYEEAPYYYIGVIDREGKLSAFLMNAQTGAILASRV